MKLVDLREKLFPLLKGDAQLFEVAIKGHFSVDQVLSAMLREQVAHAPAIEVNRISLLLKVDILTALGTIDTGSRVMYDLLNRLRNTFAHDPYADVPAKLARAIHAELNRDLQGTNQPIPGEADTLDLARLLVGWTFIRTSTMYQNVCIAKADMSVMAEMANETIHKKRHPDFPIEDVYEESTVRTIARLQEWYPDMDWIKYEIRRRESDEKIRAKKQDDTKMG